MKKKNGFLARLVRCNRGGVAEKLVVVGLFITAAAAAGMRITSGATVGGQATSDRTRQGAAGYSAAGQN